MQYEVYFAIDGKKMRTKVSAENAFDAMNKVQQKMRRTNIFYHKTVLVPIKDDVDFIKNFFGFK